MTALVCVSGVLHADDILIPSLSIDAYTTKALKEGTRGWLTTKALESAGYTREVALRQTDSPTLTAGYTQSRAGTDVNGTETLTDSKSSNLTVNQPTIFGTQVQAVGTYGDSNKPGVSANIIQPIYIFTRNATKRSRLRAELSFGNAQDTYDADVLSIRSQARSLYYEVLLAEESIKVEERKYASSRKLLDITQALVQAGKKAAVETMRARIRQQSDERQLLNAKVSRDKAIANAKSFIAYSANDPLDFTTRLTFRPYPHGLDPLLDYANKHRPQLKTLERNQQAARLAVQESEDNIRPALTVNSSYAYNELDSVQTRSWSLGGGVSWLFYDSFVTPKRTRVARIDEFVADLNLTEAKRALRLDVENSYRDIKNAEKQIQDFQNSRDQARHNVEVIRLRFQNGLERLIDVFDAENEMRDLDREYLNLVVRYHRSVDSLSELIGGDAWKLR